jgi:cytochrome c-type biogenesis protein CcmF
VTAHIAVFKDGKQIDTAYPAKWFFRKHEEEPTTEAAIRRTFAEDLHLVLAFQPSDLEAQSASLQIVINPLVNWIWFGFGMLAFGTGITLLPERTYSFALAKLPADAATATTTVSLLLLLWLSARLYRRRSRGRHGRDAKPINPLKATMRDEMACTCGSCSTSAIEMSVRGRGPDARRARTQVELGKHAKKSSLLHRAVRRPAIPTVSIDKG